MKRETSSTSISCRIRKEIANLQEKRAQLDESRQALEDAQTNNNLEKQLNYNMEQFLNWKRT